MSWRIRFEERGEILSRDHSRNTYVIVIIIEGYFDEVLN